MSTNGPLCMGKTVLIQWLRPLKCKNQISQKCPVWIVGWKNINMSHTVSIGTLMPFSPAAMTTLSSKMLLLVNCHHMWDINNSPVPQTWWVSWLTVDCSIPVNQYEKQRTKPSFIGLHAGHTRCLIDCHICDINRQNDTKSAVWQLSETPCIHFA